MFTASHRIDIYSHALLFNDRDVFWEVTSLGDYRANITALTQHKPRWGGLLHIWAMCIARCSQALSLYNMSLQNNTRLNQAQEKMVQSRDSKHEMYEAAAV